jgi:predicted RNA polymerase sigma factor
MARFPGSAGLHYRAGRLLQEAGRRPEAEREYHRAIELSPPTSPGAEQARTALAGLEGAR